MPHLTRCLGGECVMRKETKHKGPRVVDERQGDEVRAENVNRAKGGRRIARMCANVMVTACRRLVVRIIYSRRGG